MVKCKIGACLNLHCVTFLAETMVRLKYFYFYLDEGKPTEFHSQKLPIFGIYKYDFVFEFHWKHYQMVNYCLWGFWNRIAQVPVMILALGLCLPDFFFNLINSGAMEERYLCVWHKSNSFRCKVMHRTAEWEIAFIEALPFRFTNSDVFSIRCRLWICHSILRLLGTVSARWSCQCYILVLYDSLRRTSSKIATPSAERLMNNSKRSWFW